MSIANRVSNLSKCYQIYNNPRDRLKQFVLPKLYRAMPALKRFFPTRRPLATLSPLLIRHGEVLTPFGLSPSALLRKAVSKPIHLSTGSRRTDFKHNLAGSITTSHSPTPRYALPTFYKEFWALKDVSFEIKKGETVGIIGRNGSGKYTLLHMICGTLNSYSGSIQTNGHIVVRAGYGWRQKIRKGFADVL